MSQEQPATPGRSSRRRRRGRGGGGAKPDPANPGAAPPASSAPRPQPAAGASAGAGAGGGGQAGGRQGRGRGRSGGGGDRGGNRGGGQRSGNRRQGSTQQPQPARDLEITDEKILQRLLDAGLDLAQEAIFEAYLYFNSEGAARKVATQLEGGGFTTYADPSPPGRWVVEAVTRLVPSLENVAAMGSRMRSTANSNGGIYDGWWALEPPEEEEQQEVAATAPEEGLPALDFELDVAATPPLAPFEADLEGEPTKPSS